VRLQFVLISQSAAVDRFTNRLSLFNVIEALQSPRFPILIPEIVVVVALRREGNEPGIFDTTLTLSVAGNVVGHSNLRVNYENRPNVRLIANFQNLPILTPGELECRLANPYGEPIVTTVPVFQTPAA
jgi:hypothetical protein